MNKEEKFLPKGWSIVKLSEVAEVSSGGSAPQGVKYFGGSYPFIRVQHLGIDSANIRRFDLITEEAVKKYKLKLCKKGTIVFPKSGASIYLEKRAVLPFDSYVVSHLCTVKANENKINNEYLFYVLKNLRLADNKEDTYPTLNLTEIKKIEIVSPSIPEQKVMVTILSAVQQAEEKTRMLINSLRELKNSTMKHLFTYGVVPIEDINKVKLKNTEIGNIPEAWSAGSIGLIAQQQEKAEVYSDNFVSFEHMESGTGRILNVGSAKKFKSKTPFIKGTILYGRIRPYLNKVWLADRDGFSSTDIIRIIPKNCDPIFLKYILLSQKFVDFATSKSAGTKMPRVKWEAVKTFNLALPSLTEQKQIASILSAIDSKIQAEEQKKEALEQLFKSLLRDLMSGKIRVNNLKIEVKNG